MTRAELTRGLTDRIADLAQQFLGAPNRQLSNSIQLRFGAKGSVAVDIKGEKAGCWFDHEAGVGGAGLELIARSLGVDDVAAQAWARDWLGRYATNVWEHNRSSDPPISLKVRESEGKDVKRAAKVREIVGSAEPISETPAAAYLRQRGIITSPPDCIRYRRNAFRNFGALVALATDASGDVLAVQQVYLTTDGNKAPVGVAKRTNKTVDGWSERAAVRLPGKRPIILCEGVETALSVWQATGHETWACLGISNIGRAPVPENAQVIIARDADVLGSEADLQLNCAVRSLSARCLTVLIATPPPGQDFNDVLVNEGPEAICNRISSAIPFQTEMFETERKELDVGSDVEIARQLLEELSDRHGRIVYAEGEFWRYDKSHWKALAAHELRLLVHLFDGARFDSPKGDRSTVKLTRYRIDSVLYECAAMCADPDFFYEPAVGINCASGFIEFSDGGTPQLVRHRRDHRCRHTLPGRWQPDPSQKPPADSLLGTLLHGSFKGDPDGEAKADLLAEICGSAALGYATRLKQPRAVILHGKTAENGKSQVIELARGLLPANAISSVPASKMSDERHIVGLVGKLLNASDELSPDAIASDTFKSIVTGEPTSGRAVYKERTEFRSVAQHVFAANQLPGFKGGVDRGVQRRLLVIPFTRTIPLEERIEDIGKRIARSEADLLLAWAVEGASRLIQKRKFSIPASCEQALLEWVLNEDPVRAWIDACVQVVPIENGGPSISTREAFTRFQDWAKREGYRQEHLPSINGFVQRVQAQVAGAQYKRTSKARLFIGLVVTQQ